MYSRVFVISASCIMVVLAVTMYSAYAVEPAIPASVANYVRSESPTRALLYTFDVNNNEAKKWFIENRCNELCQLENCKIIKFFSGDLNSLEMAMWNRSNKIERIALMFRQIAYQDPALYQLFWERLHQSFAEKDGNKLQWPEFFTQVAPGLRRLFLKHLALRGMFEKDVDRQDRVVSDFAWLCSKGITKGFSVKDISAFICELSTNRGYAKEEAVSCNSSDLPPCKRRRLRDAQEKYLSFSKDLTTLNDQDKFFENIYARFLDKEDSLALALELCAISDSNVRASIRSCLQYAQHWEGVQRELKASKAMQKLGADILRLQQEFCYH